ncbi:uncharacterized protein STEHIDRAFT_151322 [Stereum hirsutum FP-91666 SS1]|uniref:uncharacterized protein n=1 Tax=Stereum hirsutum (strain FP-91666) TaxID=721885 RepID=UPI000440B1EF|nr:uncharacterized protein STEHIDRAFT_151322 [Stereum hirsutum FP-91666 SS1]EIM91969.1 hypothetical protein STEHIDRAFT_151322 [Stereum hirsutum FP-91666 SS1]
MAMRLKEGLMNLQLKSPIMRTRAAKAKKSVEDDEPVSRSDRRGATKDKSKSNYEEERLEQERVKELSRLLEKGPDTCSFDADVAGWSFKEQGKLLQCEKEDDDAREEEEGRGRGGEAEAGDEDMGTDDDDDDDYVGSSSSQEEEEKEDTSEGLSDRRTCRNITM